MALHQAIQRLLLIGARLPSFPHVPAPKKPARLAPLFGAVESAHQRFDRRALDYGDRYRSGFWVIYLLSAVAVLCAVLPLALGWDSPSHMFHPYARVWAICEVVIIGVVLLIYWLGHRGDWQGEWLRARTTAELTSYLPMLAPLLDFNSPALEPTCGPRMTYPFCVHSSSRRRASSWRVPGRTRNSSGTTFNGRWIPSKDSGATMPACQRSSMRCCIASTKSTARCLG
jgi:hypothetical protein